MRLIAMAVALGLVAASSAQPTITVDRDDVAITESCRIAIAPGATIVDTNRDGVLHVRAASVTIEFVAGAHLRGAATDARPDSYEGYGIRIANLRDVTIRNARVSGFRCAIWATDAPGLTIEDGDFSDSRRAYLHSEPLIESGRDWLHPHDNDDNEWLKNYAAAMYIEDTTSLVVRRCRIHDSQNALCLDRVEKARVYDNDFSFNSGWGVALWRSSHNVISRNALDFCIRGYSHGIYNRGQDSAGILAFEQNCDNVIAENSATHGGDGFFGFAGREALGQREAKDASFEYRRRGNNDNLLVGNDFSYAAAHGIEMTFSFGNRFIRNRLVGNAICGVWGGYSQETLIAHNQIAENGAMGYGLERGGINIDSSRDNRILANAFHVTRCGVHLWWPQEPHYNFPWAAANILDRKDNLIAHNTFDGDAIALHLRGPGEVTLVENAMKHPHNTIEADKSVTIHRPAAREVAIPPVPKYPVFGETRPVGARPHLRGRENIIMTEWGPWDHASPLIRKNKDTGRRQTWALHKMPATPEVELTGANVTGDLIAAPHPNAPALYTVKATAPGAHPFRFRVESGDFAQEVTGCLLVADWTVTYFPWHTDPTEDVAAWRREAQSDAAHTVCMDRLALFHYNTSAPELEKVDPDTPAVVRRRFGTSAHTSFPLPAGCWRVAVISDDGVRVRVDDEVVIEDWTSHWSSTRHTAELEIPQPRTIDVRIEHFQQRGPAALVFDIAPCGVTSHPAE